LQEKQSKEEQKETKEFEPTPLLKAFKYILDFYFGNISYETILNFAPNKKEGFDESSLIEIAYDVGLYAVKKDINATKIAKYFLPCIIFNDKDEPFIYLSFGNREATLIDLVNNKKLTIDESELKKYNKAILIFRDKKKSKYLDTERNRDWFFNPIKSFWRSYIEIGVLTFFINVFALAFPLYTRNVYDRVIPNNAFESLYVLSTGMIIILIFDSILKNIRNHIIEKVGKKLGLYFEEELMKRMLTVRAGFDSMLTGMKANLFREINQVKDFFAARSLIQILDFPFFFISLIVIYLISPVIAVTQLLIAVLIIIFNVFMQHPISNLSKDRLKNIQTKQNYLIELIRGGDVIKISNALPTKLFNWRNIVAFSDTIASKIQYLNIFALNISQTLMQSLSVIVLIVGVHEIAAHRLTMGGLIAVTILSSRGMVPIIQLSSLVVRFKEIIESLKIIDEFWNLPTESEKEIEVGVGKFKGEIEFRNVTFYYEKNKFPSLEKISFRIKPGEKVGIIGQTGAGKSTILRLLTGLDNPTNGNIYIDSHDISTIHPIELRQNIGVMLQEPFLFEGSLKENIELSHPISKERMMEVIKMTGLESLVKKSGMGDGMQVGENGSKLSTGQKHLVAMARAIVHDPSIVILDEPTTGLDIGLERTLVTKLKEIVKNKTLIVITHRIAPLELVDRVIVLNEGKIVADGPKAKILAMLQGKKN